MSSVTCLANSALSVSPSYLPAAALARSIAAYFLPDVRLDETVDQLGRPDLPTVWRRETCDGFGGGRRCLSQRLRCQGAIRQAAAAATNPANA